jgi:hypothetical protein
LLYVYCMRVEKFQFVLAFVSLILVSSCISRRTPEETKALLIGQWETVTDNDFEVPYVFTDSAIECEEFVACGKYTISDHDSLTIYGVDTTTLKITFPENANNLILTTSDWRLRLRKIIN